MLLLVLDAVVVVVVVVVDSLLSLFMSLLFAVVAAVVSVALVGHTGVAPLGMMAGVLLAGCATVEEE